MKRLLYFLLALMGVSCGMGSDMYGTPYTIFELKASVVDEQGEPIPGIAVNLSTINHDRPIYFNHDTSTSNDLGEIDASVSVDFIDPYRVHAEFVDTDGELNGGQYEAQCVEIKDIVEQVEEGKGFFSGRYRANVGQVVMHLSDTQSDDENGENSEGDNGNNDGDNDENKE